MAKANKSKKLMIMEAYYQLVSEVGFENVSMSKIAKQIDITTSLIFHHYGNKQNLTYALVDYVLEKCEASMLPEIDKGNKNPEKSFIQFIDAIFDYNDRYDSVFTRAFFACHDLALRDEHVKEKFEKRQVDIIVKHTESLKYFIEIGVIGNGDPYLASAYLAVILDGIGDRKDFSSDKKLDEQIKTEAKKQYINYLGFKG